MASELAVQTPVRRFRGQLVWLDLKLKRDPFGVELRRAIVRPGCVALEFERDGRQYDVTLNEGPDRVFRGPWQAKWNAGRKAAQDSGSVECRLKPAGTCWKRSAHLGGLELLGTWLEDDVDWRWAAELIPVEAVEDPD